MTLHPVDDEDLAALREVVQSSVLPNFAQACGKDCAARWNETAGKAMGLSATN
jgi:hypothetical protein